MMKRILSFLLAFLMVVSIFPAPAYATDSTDVTITPTETPTEAATEAPCPTCGTVGCTSEHLTWCPECKVDDCGKTHVFCEICQKNDCGQNHCPTCGTIDCTTDHGAPAAETPEEPEVHPMVGKVVKLKSDLTSYSGYRGENLSVTLMSKDGYPSVMKVTAVLEKNDVVYCRLAAVEGSWSFLEYDDNFYLESTKLEAAVWCTECEKYDCGVDHAQPTDPTDPPVAPEVPELDDGESGVVLKGTFPTDVSLSVEPADVSGQLSQFGVSGEKLVFGLDISLMRSGVDYQPGAAVRVKVPVSAAEGTKIGILHTHGGETTYIGLTEVLPDGTVEFATDRFSIFAGFTVDFHYNEIDYSIAGLTSITLSELFTILEIDRQASNAASVVFSDTSLIKVTKTDGDWLLESLKAFDTEETLEITFYDGEIITIKVTDAQTAEYNYSAGTRYGVPGSGDYITIWIDKDLLPEDILVSGTDLTWWIDGDGCDPDNSDGSISKTVASKNNTITIKDTAPLGYKFAVRNGGFRGRAIVRVIELVTFRYQTGNTVTTPTTWPSNSSNHKIGTWSIEDTTAGTTGRTNTFTISDITPQAAGYTFVNWSYTDWQNKTQTVAPGGTVRLDADSVNDDYVDFVANWTPNQYTYNIVYKTQSGTELGRTTVTKDYGTTNTITPQAFDGYVTPSAQSVKWDSTTAKTITFTYVPVSNDVTYTYTGTMYPNLPDGPATKKYSYSSSVSVEPAPTLAGYTFSGWTTSDATVSNGKFTMPNKTVTFSGYWTPNRYDLTFKYNGGKNGNTGKSDDVTYTATYEWQDYYGVGGLNPVRDGYIFTGWYTAAEGGTQVYDSKNICIPGTLYWNNNNEWVYTSGATFYAHWTPNNYTVHFDGNGATEGSMTDQGFTYDVGQNLTANAFKREYTVTYNANGGSVTTTDANTKAAATFNGWATSATGTKVYNDQQSVSNLTTTADGTYTLYANWALGKVTLPTPEERDNHAFAGWSDGTTTYAAGIDYEPTDNVTLTALWTQNNHTVTVIYNDDQLNAEGMTGFAETEQNRWQKEVSDGTVLNLCFTPKAGYRITGVLVGDTPMGTDTSGKIENYSITADITFTVTSAPIDYTITYYLGDGKLGEGITNPEVYTVEDTFTLNNPTRAGYKFKGWATSENADTGNETVTIEKGTTGDKTFYAVWERSLVDLTITATTADTNQNFIFTVSGTRSDGVAFASIDVVLCRENGFTVTIKDLPVGIYDVTEKDGWSWRENAVGSKTADLRTTSQTVSFDFYAVDDLHWLSGYSYKRKKGGS